jgi:hypothetical protein
MYNKGQAPHTCSGTISSWGVQGGGAIPHATGATAPAAMRTFDWVRLNLRATLTCTGDGMSTDSPQSYTCLVAGSCLVAASGGATELRCTRAARRPTCHIFKHLWSALQGTRPTERALPATACCTGGSDGTPEKGSVPTSYLKCLTYCSKTCTNSSCLRV